MANYWLDLIKREEELKKLQNKKKEELEKSADKQMEMWLEILRRKS